jgi:hypothetical protein
MRGGTIYLYIDISVTKIGKLLGVQITDTFNWKAHCDEVVSKLRSTAYRFSMLRASLTFPAIRNVYFADVQSHILYTIVIWGGSPHMQQIFTAQKRCVRAMAGKRYWRGPAALDSCKPLFHEFNILKLSTPFIFLNLLNLLKNTQISFQKIQTILTQQSIARETQGFQANFPKSKISNEVFDSSRSFNQEMRSAEYQERRVPSQKCS